MIRRTVALILSAVALASCGLFSDLEQDFSPSLPQAYGARMTDGELRVWTGSRCTEIKQLAFFFHPHGVELLLTSNNFIRTTNKEAGTDVEYLTLGPNPGWTITEPLPAGFDWKTAKSFRLAGAGVGEKAVDIATIVEESALHPIDTYWFQGIGWLSPADVAAKDGKTFLAACTPDPNP